MQEEHPLSSELPTSPASSVSPLTIYIICAVAGTILLLIVLATVRKIMIARKLKLPKIRIANPSTSSIFDSNRYLPDPDYRFLTVPGILFVKFLEKKRKKKLRGGSIDESPMFFDNSELNIAARVPAVVPDDEESRMPPESPVEVRASIPNIMVTQASKSSVDIS